ncbi:hypothetical protein ACFUTV_43335 [Streptomyces sp. NPDC057298]|uniref:hypothetical protein n=1 Tax=Streptomyces sp. NPDC057298 TaxID=3346091 RepID=UPI00362C0CAD
MFEIRIICAPADTDHAVAALDSAFNAGTVTVYPSRDGETNRLYVRAEHKHAPERNVTQWPNATEAYAAAPEPEGEMLWLSNTEDRGRDWWLRRAALFDRMASGLIPGYTASPRNALDLASRLMDLDGTAEGYNPRAYVRQQYIVWQQQERRRALIADGRCPNCQWPEQDCNCADHPDA